MQLSQCEHTSSQHDQAHRQTPYYKIVHAWHGILCMSAALSAAHTQLAHHKRCWDTICRQRERCLACSTHTEALTSAREVCLGHRHSSSSSSACSRDPLRLRARLCAPLCLPALSRPPAPPLPLPPLPGPMTGLWKASRPSALSLILRYVRGMLLRVSGML